MDEIISILKKDKEQLSNHHDLLFNLKLKIEKLENNVFYLKIIIIFIISILIMVFFYFYYNKKESYHFLTSQTP